MLEAVAGGLPLRGSKRLVFRSFGTLGGFAGRDTVSGRSVYIVVLDRGLIL
jgi:hypothetical protein